MKRTEAQPADPPPDCGQCPRLAGLRRLLRDREPAWHNAPVPSLLPPAGADTVRLLIVGLAPGLRGANRTGRAFTGDRSGTMLFAALERHGLAMRQERSEDPALVATAITNAVRCVPPQNRPVAAEINACRSFLAHTIGGLPRLRVILTLGRIANDATVRALDCRCADHPFAHGARSELAGIALIASYHCSRHNTNTGRLTEAMFDRVIAEAAGMTGSGSSPSPSLSRARATVAPSGGPSRAV